MDKRISNEWERESEYRRSWAISLGKELIEGSRASWRKDWIDESKVDAAAADAGAW